MKQQKSATLSSSETTRHSATKVKAATAAKTTASKTNEIQEALEQLEESERLQQVGELQKALDVSERALGVLIQYLRTADQNTNNDKSCIVGGTISKDVLRSTVEVSLSNAEQIKRQIKQRHQQQQRQQPQRPPPKLSPTSMLSSAMGKLSWSKSTDSERSSTSIRPSHSHDSYLKKPQHKQHHQQQPQPPKKQSYQSQPRRPKQQTNPTSAGSVATKSSTIPLACIPRKDDPMVQLVKRELYVDASRLQNSLAWEDIAGLEYAKQALQEAAILPLLRPDLFTGLRAPQNILLYGPPGTGKTILVKAIAKQSPETMLFVCTASALTSKWHGEGEKLLRTLFSVARAAAPSIIFIDEVDALLSARKSSNDGGGGGEHEASRRFKTEFMTQVDGITSNSTKDSKLLLMACTNCPWDLDAAVLRRFPKRIFIGLPDEATRKALVQTLLKQSGAHSLTKQQIKDLVKRLDGYSGSDIASIAAEASFGPLRSMSIQDIQHVSADKLRPISYDDFMVAMDQATKSTPRELLDKYDQWRLDHQKGGSSSGGG